MNIIDLTFLVENDMPTCGTEWHQNVEIKQLGKIEEVGRNTHSILLGSHTGTHMDAPYHFINDGDTIEQLDLNLLCGDVTIISFMHIKKRFIEVSDIEHCNVTERMLFAFGWYKNWKTSNYYKGFPYFSTDAVEFLVKNGMKMMAIDTPSPDNEDAITKLEDSPNHKFLLKNGVILVEYLTNTEKIDVRKKYVITALPLKISGSDGSPCRVILKEVDGYDKYMG